MFSSASSFNQNPGGWNVEQMPCSTALVRVDVRLGIVPWTRTSAGAWTSWTTTISSSAPRACDDVVRPVRRHSRPHPSAGSRAEPTGHVAGAAPARSPSPRDQRVGRPQSSDSTCSTSAPFDQDLGDAAPPVAPTSGT